MRAARIERYGGPEQLRVVEQQRPVASAGELLLAVDASGVNFTDVWRTENAHGLDTPLPYVPGLEVVGRDADGNRLVALCVDGGGFAEAVAVPRAEAFPVPDGVDDVAAVAAVVQGCTAWHLLRTVCPLRPGDSVLVHAGAGGVGTLAIQLARLWGAGTIVATASTPAKRALAAELGADVVLDSGEDLLAGVRAATGGAGVDVALDSVGGDVFDATLAALAPLGRLGHYGISSRREPTPVNPRDLVPASLAIAGFYLGDLALARRAEAIADLMRLFAAGDLRAVAGGAYGLDEAGEALRALAARETTGKLLVRPNGQPA